MKKKLNFKNSGTKLLNFFLKNKVFRHNNCPPPHALNVFLVLLLKEVSGRGKNLKYYFSGFAQNGLILCSTEYNNTEKI